MVNTALSWETFPANVWARSTSLSAQSEEIAHLPFAYFISHRFTTPSL